MTPPTQTARQRNKVAELYYRSQRKLRIQYFCKAQESHSGHDTWITDYYPGFFKCYVYRIAPKKKGKG